jgi:peptide/nickel transport system permease protein
MSYHVEYAFSPVLTDLLLYGLVLIVGLACWYARRQPHLRASWARVFARPVGMITVTILLFYVSVGLLDSIHFKKEIIYNKTTVTNASSRHSKTPSVSGVESVLGFIFSESNAHLEKSFSAPLSLHSYTKATVYLPSGLAAQRYQPLLYAGHHNLSQSHTTDILLRVLIGVALTFGVLLIVIFLVYLFFLAKTLRRKQKAKVAASGFLGGLSLLWKGKTQLAWRSGVVTAVLILMLILIAFELTKNYHVLGTNKVGEDVLFISLDSIRTGLLIGLLATLFMLPFALILGPLAGYFGGWVDDLIQYIYTTMSSIPGVLLITACLIVLRAYIDDKIMLASAGGHQSVFLSQVFADDFKFLGLCVILGVTGWAGLCRLLRAETMKLREQPFVIAAKTLGQKQRKIIFKHILPNVMHIVLITVVLDFSGWILSEAVLTYVGVGVPKSLNSWGGMIHTARLELSRDPVVWWPLLSALVFMFVFVLSINFLADAVRDAFDHRS